MSLFASTPSSTVLLAAVVSTTPARMKKVELDFADNDRLGVKVTVALLFTLKLATLPKFTPLASRIFTFSMSELEVSPLRVTNTLDTVTAWSPVVRMNLVKLALALSGIVTPAGGSEATRASSALPLKLTIGAPEVGVSTAPPVSSAGGVVAGGVTTAVPKMEFALLLVEGPK